MELTKSFMFEAAEALAVNYLLDEGEPILYLQIGSPPGPGSLCCQ